MALNAKFLTINSIIKMKKNNRPAKKGLKNIGKSETFTSAKIASLIKNLQLKANKFDAAMEKFNDKTTIDLGELSSEFESYVNA